MNIPRHTFLGRPAFIALALCLGSAPLLAQNTLPAPGERVRVQLGKGSGVKTFKFKDIVSDTLVVDDLDANSPDLRIPLASVSKFQVSDGSRSAGTRAARGAAIGFGSGFVIGGIVGLAAGDDGEGLASYTGSEMAAAFGGLVGGVGLVLGTIVGVSSPSQKWRSIPLRHITVAPNANGALVIGLRGTF